MQTTEENTNANSAPEPITAEEILMSIIEWEPMAVREDLHEIMCVFFMHRPKYRKRYMESLYLSYRLLFDALLQMEQYRKERGLLEPNPMQQENERVEREQSC